MENAAKVGAVVPRAVARSAARHPEIGDVRGKGLFLGIELVKDRASKQPAAAFCDAVITRAFHNGLLLLSCGTSTIRLIPPLLVSAAEVDEALTILEASLNEAREQLGAVEEDASSADGRPPVADLLAATDRTEGGRRGAWLDIARADWPATASRCRSGRAGTRTSWTPSSSAASTAASPPGRWPWRAYVPRLVERGGPRGLLVMPLLNPWGYLHHVRYGPSGQSVSDSDHLLGRAPAPACPEAAAITAFVMDGVRIRPGAASLDLHEDPVYEAPDYQFEGSGSYIYVTGDGAMTHPASRRVRDCLLISRLPLVREGVTRFGERLTDGVIVDTADGSIDELLARRAGCSPVITVENLLHAPDSPPLAERVDVYIEVLEAFFGAPGGE